MWSFWVEVNLFFFLIIYLNMYCRLGTDHLTCKGVMVFFTFKKFLARIFFQNLTLGYMTKTLSDYFFFSSTKIRIFFQQHWESEYFFLEKTHNTPHLEVNWSVPYKRSNYQEERVVMPLTDLILPYFLCLSQDRTWSSNITCRLVFFK